MASWRTFTRSYVISGVSKAAWLLDDVMIRFCSIDRGLRGNCRSEFVIIRESISFTRTKWCSGRHGKTTGSKTISTTSSQLHLRSKYLQPEHSAVLWSHLYRSLATLLARLNYTWLIKCCSVSFERRPLRAVHCSSIMVVSSFKVSSLTATSIIWAITSWLSIFRSWMAVIAMHALSLFIDHSQDEPGTAWIVPFLPVEKNGLWGVMCLKYSSIMEPHLRVRSWKASCLNSSAEFERHPDISVTF